MKVTMRALKLGSLHHWWQTGAVRAFRRWALVLELRASYDAAFGHAAMVCAQSGDALLERIQAASQQTVETLLLEPGMLQPLGDLRFKLQQASNGAEALRDRLVELKAEGNARALEAPWMPRGDDADQLRRLALPTLQSLSGGAAAANGGKSGGGGSGGGGGGKGTAAVITQAQAQDQAEALGALRAEMRALAEAKVAGEAQAMKESGYVALKLRLVVQNWRAVRRELETQQQLLRQLSAKRNEELAAAEEEAAQLRQLRATLAEVGGKESTLRQQLVEQELALASSVAAAAKVRVAVHVAARVGVTALLFTALKNCRHYATALSSLFSPAPRLLRPFAVRPPRGARGAPGAAVLDAHTPGASVAPSAVAPAVPVALRSLPAAVTAG